jgi:hypothetical protein
MTRRRDGWVDPDLEDVWSAINVLRWSVVVLGACIIAVAIAGLL